MVSTALLGDVNSGLVQGLTQEDCVRVHAALDYAAAGYGERTAASGQGAFEFSLGAAGTLAYLNTDAETRIAGLLFELPDPGALTAAGSAALAYMAVVPMGVCYLCWFAALRRLPPALASVGTLLVPLVGVVAAALGLGEPLGAREGLALALTLGGVSLALRQA